MKEARKDLSKPTWQATHVRGLVEEDGYMWNSFMIDTYNTHYNTYYATAHTETAAANAPSTHYDAAVRWVWQLQRQSHQQWERWIKVKEAIRRRRERMEEEKAAVEATKVEKEEQKVEEVGVVVDMVSGKQIVQS